MKIHGVLSWYNESPSWLAATVASFARVCDTLTAVDGRYALFEQEMAASPVSEAVSIVETCEGAGLPLTLHRPTEPFYGNEVEKRNLLLRLALVNAEPMEDWILILDGDEYIVHADHDFRDKVAATRDHAIAYALEEYLDPFDPDKPLDIARVTAIPNMWRVPLRAMYRVLPGMEYRGAHNRIGGYIGGEWVWLWGHTEMVPDRKLISELVVRHRNVVRPRARREQAAAYYQQRDELGIEEVTNESQEEVHSRDTQTSATDKEAAHHR